ncbi:hypothetical protein CFC21_004527 [Triticum aestivum]|uniref:Uncharacterized protein n=1 Tax=Triticum aestivum TaxID=4565 RepID=A0A3B5Y7G1_WHEAT|nr:uncharacterized protein LOC119349383 [Triticum dicoccoides]XP_044452007.1 uncharacterized protein LOC123183293 isoform X1 [Triticum aestivum]KAF6986807.1 hypothetical protein CFC21_004527 [Triticum aestivum]
MAATALRTTCQRIGGRALRPWLAPAAAHQNQPTTSRLFHSTKAAATHSAEIQQVKEELYCMMSENRDKIGNQKGLIKHLSSHVEPKPEDPVWRFYRRAKWYHLVMMYSPAFLYGYMSMLDVPDGKKEMTPAEKDDFNKRMAALMPNVEL